MFMLVRLGTLRVVVARALAMMAMPGMLRGLMTSMLLRRTMRMSPRRKQTVRQMQQNCTEGDEFEVLARHLVPIVSNRPTGVNCNSVALFKLLYARHHAPVQPPADFL